VKSLEVLTDAGAVRTAVGSTLEIVTVFVPVPVRLRLSVASTVTRLVRRPSSNLHTKVPEMLAVPVPPAVIVSPPTFVPASPQSATKEEMVSPPESDAVQSYV
jgi:hypothetical protein